MLVHSTDRFVVTVEIWCRSPSVNGINQESQKHGRRESTQKQITVFRRNNVRKINFTYYERVRCFGFVERKLNVVTIFVFTYMYMCKYVCMNVRILVGMWVRIMHVYFCARVYIYMYVEYIYTYI